MVARPGEVWTSHLRRQNRGYVPQNGTNEPPTSDESHSTTEAWDHLPDVSPRVTEFPEQSEGGKAIRMAKGNRYADGQIARYARCEPPKRF